MHIILIIFTAIMRLTFIIFTVLILLFILESTNGRRAKSIVFKRCRNLPKKSKRRCVKRSKNRIRNLLKNNCKHLKLKRKCIKRMRNKIKTIRDNQRNFLNDTCSVCLRKVLEATNRCCTNASYHY